MREMIVIVREMCEEIRVPDIDLSLLLLCYTVTTLLRPRLDRKRLLTINIYVGN